MSQLSIPNLVQQIEAEQLLAQFLPDLENCILEAKTLCHSLGESNPRLLKASSKGARSHLMNDVACDVILERLRGNPRLRFFRQYRSLYMLVDNRLLVRFKRFYSWKFRSSNILTNFQRRLMQQAPLPELDAPVATRVTLGWLMDKLGWEIRDIAIACPSGDENVWSFSILGSGGSVGEAIRIQSPGPVDPSMPSIRPKEAVRELRTEQES